MDKVELSSYAKVNLTLKVSAPRGDGYHDIDSVVQVIDLRDVLVVSRSREGAIDVTTDAAGVPCGSENLVFKACRVFFDETRVRGGAECYIHKTVPAQAGLGGGSSNAASAIAALDQLYQTHLSLERLIRISAKVGSDVPLFAVGGTVRMRGRGDRVQPLPDAPKMDLVIIKPDRGVSTAWAYSELDKAPRPQSDKASDAVERAVATGDGRILLESLSNDFDPVVSRAVPEVAAARQTLLEMGAQRALLCGSGSAVFGVFESRHAAESAAERARCELPGNLVFVSSFVARESTLHVLQETEGIGNR